MTPRGMLIALALWGGSGIAAAQGEPAVAGVRAAVAPPPPRVEVRAAAPAPGMAFDEGHWAWRGPRHVWVPGVWLAPPSPSHAWVPSRWLHKNDAWIFFEGYWQRLGPPPTEGAVRGGRAARAAVIVVDQPPPPPLLEQPPAKPSPSALWIPGYWHWHGGRHAWVAGYFEAPRAGFAWEPASWQPDGGRFRFVAGHWRKL